MFMLCAAVGVSNGGCSGRTLTTKATPSLSEQLYPVTFSMTRSELVARLPVDSTDWLLLTTPSCLDPMEIATLPSGLRIQVAFNKRGAMKVIHVDDPKLTLPDGLSLRSTARDIRLLHPHCRYLCFDGYGTVIEVAAGIRIAFFPWTESEPEPTSTPAWIEIHPEAMKAHQQVEGSSLIDPS